MLNLLDQVESNLAQKQVSIVEFSESDAYCGKRLYPRQRVLLKLIFLEELEGWEEDILEHWINGGHNGTEIKISPNVRERSEYLIAGGYNHFREVDLVGGRRSSKGFLTGLALGKVMWDCLQLQNPGRYYGIDPEKDIYFSCVAGSESQAKEFQYADFVSTVESCKAFDQYLVKSLETEFRVATPEDLRTTARDKAKAGKIMRDVAKLRGKALAANAGTLRGSATMGLAIDEMAHMIPGESKASADQVYIAAVPSLDQFGPGGMIFCNSSPYTKVGMFYQRHEIAMLPFDPNRQPEEDGNGNPLTFTFQFPSWGLFDEYWKDPGRRFKKAITVSPDWDENDENLSEEDRRQVLIARSEEASNPDTYKVERRGKFAEVTDAYLNPDMVDRMYGGIPAGGFDENGGYVLSPISTNFGEGATYRYRYKAHVDPSSTTAGFGFALGHIEMFTDPDGREHEHTVFDIIKKWNPKDFAGDVIRWGPILDELEEWCAIFRPFELTFDQHQSAEPIQDLTERLNSRNINTRVYEKYATNEYNWKRAEVFKTALYQGLVHAPYDTADLEWSNLELKYLQQKNSGGRYPRIDRQEIGPVQTKDMADCVMEVTQTLIGNLMMNRARDRLVNSVMAPGAIGGYSIGGNTKLTNIHPELAEYYGNRTRKGEQRGTPDYHTTPTRGRIGGRRPRQGGGSPSRGI